MRRLLVLLALASVLASCRGTTNEPVPGEQVGVSIYHDDDRQVTCWVLYGWHGISCLPDSHLR